MSPKNTSDEKLLLLLALIQVYPSRNPEAEKTGREIFLQKAKNFAAAVTPVSPIRHKKQENQLTRNSHLLKKETRPMFNLFSSLIIALSLLFGSGAATVAAAQVSQPNEALYNVKLYSENALLDLTSNPQSQFDLALDLVDRRYDEIQKLIAQGFIPTSQDLQRYKAQIEISMRVAASLPDTDAIQALSQLQTHLETQSQAFFKTQANNPGIGDMTMTMLQDMLQERIQLVINGEDNLIQLRDQIREQDQLNAPDQQNENNSQFNNYGTSSGSSNTTNQNPQNGNGANSTTTPSSGSSTNYQNSGSQSGSTNSTGYGSSSSGSNFQPTITPKSKGKK